MANTKITTRVIADDAITSAQIADNAINSEHYVDGSIDTAHYADNSITGAELADNIVIAGTLGSTGKITADAGIDIDNFNIDGTTIALSSGDLTLDVAADIILDAGGNEIKLKTAGTEWGQIYNSSSDLAIYSSVQDKDIKLQGNDGGSVITALTLDMSDAGKATFNSSVLGTIINAGTLSSVGIGAATADANVAELGAGYLNLGRDDTASSAQISFSKNGIIHSSIVTDNNDLRIKGNSSNLGIRFDGNDGGSAITALRLDMADAGNAAFSAGATFARDVNITLAGNSDNLTLTTTDGDASAGPNLRFFRNSGSPANNDLAGTISFDCKNNAGQTVTLAGIDNYILDVADGSEDGELTITTMVGGTTRNRLDFTNTSTIVNESGIDMDFRVESSAKTHAFFVQGSGNEIFFGASSTTYPQQNNFVNINTASGVSMTIGGHSGTHTSMVFKHDGANTVGSVVVNASGTTYNTSSDYRLKENVVTNWDATTRLKQLKPSRFNFIKDAGTTVDGFLAHEVESIVPEAISGTKDALFTAEDETNNKGIEGQPNYQGIDQGKLVPLLVKTIQELEARITALES